MISPNRRQTKLQQSPRDPQEAERRRLTKLIDTEHVKPDRLLDAYTDGALDLAKYKRRRADIENEVGSARARLPELAAAPVGEPAAPAGAELRRHVADAQR